MTVFLFATSAEARPFLERVTAAKVLDQPFETHAYPAAGRRAAGLVVISGMGPVRAAAATAYAITARGARRVINAGICGALHAGLQTGGLRRITAVINGDAAACGDAAPPLDLATASPWATLPPARLATVTEPVFGGERRDRLAAAADVVDMEGWAVAQTCQRHHIPCLLFKGVSDMADTAGRDELQRNLAAVSDLLAQTLADGLAVLPRAERGSLLVRLANFVKVEHTIFSLPLLFAGAWLGAGGHWPGLRPLFWIALAGLGARALGMAMNRILDRRLDLLNPRTAGRELPSGRLTPAQGWSVAAAGLAVYLLACTALGPLCLLLSPIPAAVLITYSLLKRFTSLCHYGIGACLALGPLGAFVAVAGTTAVSPAVILLALFTFCWISGFDIIYALQDLAADREIGVHSLPAALGSRGAQIVAAATHLVAIAAVARVGQLTGGGAASGLAFAVAVAAFGLAYVPRVPLPARFFPTSAIAGIAGALIPLLGGVL